MIRIMLIYVNKKIFVFLYLKIIAFSYIFCKKRARKKEKVYHHQKQIEINDIIYFNKDHSCSLFKILNIFQFFLGKKNYEKRN